MLLLLVKLNMSPSPCLPIACISFVCQYCRRDSDSMTPPGSPAVTQLKEMFPSKSPLARKPSRFSISRVSFGVGCCVSSL